MVWIRVISPCWRRAVGGVGPVILAALIVATAVACKPAAVRPTPTAPPPTATTPPPTPTRPGISNIIFVRDACEWSGIDDKAVCWGTYAAGHQVRFVAVVGPRIKVWDPETRNIGYVDREALGLPLSAH